MPGALRSPSPGSRLVHAPHTIYHIFLICVCFIWLLWPGFGGTSWVLRDSGNRDWTYAELLLGKPAQVSSPSSGKLSPMHLHQADTGFWNSNDRLGNLVPSFSVISVFLLELDYLSTCSNTELTTSHTVCSIIRCLPLPRLALNTGNEANDWNHHFSSQRKQSIFIFENQMSLYKPNSSWLWGRRCLKKLVLSGKVNWGH